MVPRVPRGLRYDDVPAAPKGAASATRAASRSIWRGGGGEGGCVQYTPLHHAASAGASTAAYSRVHWLVCITSTQTRVRRTLCPFGRGYLLSVFADRGAPLSLSRAPVAWADRSEELRRKSLGFTLWHAQIHRRGSECARRLFKLSLVTDACTTACTRSIQHSYDLGPKHPHAYMLASLSPPSSPPPSSSWWWSSSMTSCGRLREARVAASSASAESRSNAADKGRAATVSSWKG